MINDPQGRYARAEQRLLVGADGREHAWLLPRLLPAPEAMKIIAVLALNPAERLDGFTARTLGDPRAWWRIADANRAMNPDDLAAPGTRLKMPLPEAGQ
jgi:hypothetical protein